MQLLLIENNDIHVRLIQALLERGLAASFFLDRAESLTTALGSLGRRKPDAIILDLDQPECNGLDSLYALQPCAVDTPIVVISDNDDPAVALAAIQFGAQDYLVKSKTNSAMLARSILFAVARAVRSRQQHRQRCIETIAEEMP